MGGDEGEKGLSCAECGVSPLGICYQAWSSGARPGLAMGVGTI